MLNILTTRAKRQGQLGQLRHSIHNGEHVKFAGWKQERDEGGEIVSGRCTLTHILHLSA